MSSESQDTTPHCEFCTDKVLREAGVDEGEFDAIRAYCTLIADEGPIDVEAFREAYAGSDWSDAAFARRIVDEFDYLRDVPRWISSCINYDDVWENMSVDFGEQDGHYFRLCKHL